MGSAATRGGMSCHLSPPDRHTHFCMFLESPRRAQSSLTGHRKGYVQQVLMITFPGGPTEVLPLIVVGLVSDICFQKMGLP